MLLTNANSRLAFLLLFSAALVFAGCRLVTSPEEIIGMYILDSRSGNITLEVLPNGCFKETIAYNSGQSKKIEGKWHWQHHAIHLENLLIPTSFTPEMMPIVELMNARKAFEHPEVWSITPEERWGKIRLPIDPDNSVEFVMKR
jgi:hypothetical protein